ncbi:MAG: peptidase MA family metallohydrolase, partial [Anaerolineales bacterium]
MFKCTGRLWITFLIMLLSISSAGAISGFAQKEDIETNVQYTFGEYIDFQGVLPQGIQAERVVIFIKAAGENQTRTGEPNMTDEGEFEMRYDLRDQPIRAYSKIIYWIEVTTTDGDVIELGRESFDYEDDRFKWQTKESSQVRVHWYEGDTTFAQSVLDTAKAGIQNIQELLPLELEGKVDIYVYASAKEMRDTLQMSGTNWIGAHTDPDLGVMVVSLPPGPEQRLEMERQIPHELMHIMLYQNLGPAYDNLPTWFNEGLGSVAE